MPMCPYCHGIVSKDTRFCPRCGRSLVVERVVVAGTVKGKSKKKIAGIVVACIAAITVIAVLARPPAAPVAEPLSPPEQGWIRLRIADVGSIDYPPDFLELQSGDYREIVEDLVPGYEIPSSDFILQQAGLNELGLSALEEYRRVILETYYLNPGEEVFRANENYAMSQEELAEIHNELINQLNQEYARIRSMGLGDNRIIDLGSVKTVNVNGMFPLLCTYKRQLDDNPAVIVRHYVFWNYSKVHHLVFSNRVVDEEQCRGIYEKILYSLRLRN